MEETKFFLHQIKHTNNVFDKGIVVKETFEAAKQSYHAYLGAYAYGQSAETDFVSVLFLIQMVLFLWVKIGINQ